MQEIRIQKMEDPGCGINKMPQSAVKSRLDRYKKKVLKSLLENYRIVETAEYPFHFFCMNPNGFKHIRIEVDSLSEMTKKEILKFKKICPRNTIFEVRIFEKYDRDPKRIIL